MIAIKQCGLLTLVWKRSGKLFREMGRGWHSSGVDKNIWKEKEVLILYGHDQIGCSSAIEKFETRGNGGETTAGPRLQRAGISTGE